MDFIGLLKPVLAGSSKLWAGLCLASLVLVFSPGVLLAINLTREHAILSLVVTGCLWVSATAPDRYRSWSSERTKRRSLAEADQEIDDNIRRALERCTTGELMVLRLAFDGGGQAFIPEGADMVHGATNGGSSAAAIERLQERNLLKSRGLKPNPERFPFMAHHCVVPERVMRAIEAGIDSVAPEQGASEPGP